MKSSFALTILSLFASHGLSASVDMWSSPLSERDAPNYKPIEPEVIKSRLDTTPQENSDGGREPGSVYFCRGENWGPPCFEYQPELEYTCTELNGKLQNHVGSVFAEPEIICRLATFKNRCVPLNIFGWPEISKGSANLLLEKAPSGSENLGNVVTHFTCAKCTNCIRGPK
ncbi:hypothetical protein ACLX1H_003759 [Fusarium chlamydosporum]